ncbi:protein CrcB homolog [Gordonia araii NBRC 100433]|uniref:Fluoride-specific ion channel FluC n=1 Tax=Gordonia araii NBRC 100433 TaxID=1073574 RepID=G7H1Z5_9ACTN|nr:CrcB family protein [Gordonia araii]NNG97203.1 CrcB family protein [Gordonia araii NBRC 100433]GAB09870.1 protein CrcB homolog [Gordonia araii NBRC 100433]
MNAWTAAAYAAGGLGALARYVIDASVKARVTAQLPVATIAINIAGSALLGLITGLVVFAGTPSTLALVAGTGFCGGFTTFSTASFETVALARRGETRLAVVNAVGSWVAAVLACGAGMWVAWLIR